MQVSRWLGEKYDGMRCCWNPIQRKLYPSFRLYYFVLIFVLHLSSVIIFLIIYLYLFHFNLQFFLLFSFMLLSSLLICFILFEKMKDIPGQVCKYYSFPKSRGIFL